VSNTLAIAIHDLHKRYGRMPALGGVDLEVSRGELFGFLGPNGAGKTTTIRCLLDLIRPDAGEIRVLGLDPHAQGLELRSQTGYLPGELNLDPALRAGAMLRYLAHLRGSRVDWGHVQALASRLEIDLHTPIKNLSKGNKQKVGIVQALMARPTLLLLDEPTAGLDPLMQQRVYSLLRSAQAEGATVFFSSHIISEVELLADRVAMIRDGRIVDLLEPRSLAERAIRRVLVVFATAINSESLHDVPGVTRTEQLDQRRLKLHIQGDMDALVKALALFPVESLEVERPSLEEAFLASYSRPSQEVAQ